MQTRPPDLSDAAVAAAVSAGWGLAGLTAAYLPVGYGSHHWSVEDGHGGRWFASVDVLPVASREASFERLAAALAVALAGQAAGLTFCVAPLPTTNGGVLRRLGSGYALALYPHVSGDPGRFDQQLDPAEAAELLHMLGALHQLPRPAAGLEVESFAIAGRAGLVDCLDRLAERTRWPGPYGGRLHELLSAAAGDIRRVLLMHDQLIATAGTATDQWVVTHGEPHPGNLLRTADGLALIDWETARIAPAERDLWLVDARTRTDATAEYTAVTGRTLAPELLVRYRLAWALADVAVFVELLRDSPEETADTAWSWDALRGTVAELAAEPADPSIGAAG